MKISNLIKYSFISLGLLGGISNSYSAEPVTVNKAGLEEKLDSFEEFSEVLGKRWDSLDKADKNRFTEYSKGFHKEYWEFMCSLYDDSKENQKRLDKYIKSYKLKDYKISKEDEKSLEGLYPWIDIDKMTKADKVLSHFSIEFSKGIGGL